MCFVVMRAYLMLIYFDLFLVRKDFRGLYNKVRRFPLASVQTDPGTSARTCAAMDTASIWYWKEVLCLQRSAATACLLRTYGLPAQMLIGVQQVPFRAHAWVELAGQVVNDRPYVRDMYAVLDYC